MLAEYLAHDAANVRKILGDFVIVLTVSLFTMVFGLVIALYSCYQLALVVLGCLPLVIISTALGRKGFNSSQDTNSIRLIVLLEQVQMLKPLASLRLLSERRRLPQPLCRMHAPSYRLAFLSRCTMTL